MHEIGEFDVHADWVVGYQICVQSLSGNGGGPGRTS